MTTTGDSNITNDWLEIVLASYHQKRHHSLSPRVKIRDFSITSGSDQTDSQLSDLLAISVTYDDLGDGKSYHADLIAKLLPQDPVNRFAVSEAKFDRREIYLYTRLLPDLTTLLEKKRKETAGAGGHRNELLGPLPLPVCYHAVYKPDCESILVLENLKVVGYKLQKFSQGLSDIQVKAALREIARVHATSFALRGGKTDLLEHYDFLLTPAQAASLYDQFINKGLPQLIDYLRGMQGETAKLGLRLKKYLGDNKELYQSLVSPTPPLVTLTHNDFWSNNLLFKENSSGKMGGDADHLPECKIIDWQLCQVSRPSIDVALLLLSSTTADARKKSLNDFLHFYWSALTESANACGFNLETEYEYSLDRFTHEYRESRLLATLLCAASVDVALGDADREKRMIDLLREMAAENVI